MIFNRILWSMNRLTGVRAGAGFRLTPDVEIFPIASGKKRVIGERFTDAILDLSRALVTMFMLVMSFRRVRR